MLGALLRYKTLVIGVTLAATLAGVVASRFVHPQYVAQATVWIDQEDRRGGPDRGPIRPDQAFDAEAWVDLLRSYAVLDSVARDLRLYLAFRNPVDSTAGRGFALGDHFRPGTYDLKVAPAGSTFVLSTAAGTEVQHGAVGDSIGLPVGFRWAPAPGTLGANRTIRFAVTAPRDAAQRLGDALDAHIDEEGNFLRLELEGPNPALLAATLNAIAARYVTVAADLQRQKLTERTKILGQQLTYSQQGLRQAETALQSFRERTITLPADRPSARLAAPGDTSKGSAIEDPVFANFFDMQMERDAARRDRDAIASALQAAGDSGVSVTALAGIGAVQRYGPLADAIKEWTARTDSLRVLRRRYSDAYPPVAQLEAVISGLERQTIPQFARLLVGELDSHQKDLDQRVAGVARGLRDIPARTIEEARLRRDYASSENLYTNLEQRYEEAQLAEASTVPDVRILDPAVVPERPTKNTAPRLIFLALLGGLGVGVCGAVLLDRVDSKIRYPMQVSRDMGLTILGSVPHLKLARRDSLLLPDEAPAFLEALRGIRMNIEYALGESGPMTFALTSPGSGDGKSLISANLACTFAEGSHRTLLIDGDIRRGALHRRCGAQRRPGLSDLLRGDVTLERVIQRTQYGRLDILPCGTRTHDAPELLAGAAMSRLLAQLRAGYDVILCDSPPLTAGIDPFMLGTATGNLVVVLRTGVSHREVTEAKLEVIERMPIRLLGAVLNDVPEGAAYGYYSYYLPGYEAEDEKDPRAIAPGPAAVS
ncbi:MAG TPA: polysaccharide biosynthesis tyrosine autokinase [Gemmatimonadales bacterium]|nr:polysaccharide biosynthesis tyrosine autokinase [Gemmatimonadales bacterium]